MKAVGVIVEYNPFHNGHYYHLQETKQQTKADVMIAIMSGHFLQRGEPSLLSKWERARLALAGGADLVIEIPYPFATGKAEVFANGSISLLNHLYADEVCFGSEEGDISPFIHTYQFLQQHQQDYDKRLKMFLQQGHSYPKAAALSFQTFTSDQPMVDLSQPNNILGFHYVKAIYDQKAAITPQTIQRSHAGYHDTTMHHAQIASATSIRRTLLDPEQSIQAIKHVVPSFTYELLQESWQSNGMFNDWEALFPFLQYQLLTSQPEDIAAIYEAEEGLEHRLLSYIKSADSFHSFMKQIKTKRYTWTRLQRLCTHILTQADKTTMQTAIQQPEATYLRLLGMSAQGQHYLNTIKKDMTAPLITNASQDQQNLSAIDQQATLCYMLGYDSSRRIEKLAEEFDQPPVRYSMTTS